MRHAALALGLLVSVAVLSMAADPVPVLIVDRTEGFVESMQVEVLARVLMASGLFTIRATLEVPQGPHPRGPFLFVVMIPPETKWAWICTPGLPEALPRELRGALTALKRAVEQVFRGERRAKDPGDDLYPWVRSLYFLHSGILGGVR
ncbi:MAG TPA: hypothetical protein ENN53_07020 [Candidatus Acetothermia bacterium]|nr:hypothetical protein [Candidatus Acetothermia bacterium]